MQLTQEFIRIFGIELAIICKVGSGISLQGCIERNIRAIGFCKTKEHRTFVFDNLVQWVKSLRLVLVESAPKKPFEIIDFERNMAAPKETTKKPVEVVSSHDALAMAPTATTATVVPGAAPIVAKKVATTRGFGNVVL